MSQPELLRELQLPQAHLSAASALVRVAERLFVVADDELHLGVFDLGDPAAGRLVRLFEGSLPAEKKARKAAKPDLEALALLPAMADFAQGALLALGSGSTPGRTRPSRGPARAGPGRRRAWRCRTRSADGARTGRRLTPKE